ncbi:hypothetical protein FE236_02825 [Mariprofundus erugo]|nr:hypothetical protein FE236_02825 [Mariprofundus erugo]
MKTLLAHGSSDSAHGAQVEALAKHVSNLIGEEVRAAFLSDERLPAGSVVLPLFLGAGKHLSEDVPTLVAASGATLLPSLNEYAEQLVTMACNQLTRESTRIHALFAIYRYSGFEPLVAAIHSANSRCSLVATASLHSEPSLTSVLNRWQSDGVGPITVQPMLLFGGHTLGRLQAMIEDASATDVLLAPVLSECDGFAALIAGCLKAQS